MLKFLKMTVAEDAITTEETQVVLVAEETQVAEVLEEKEVQHQEVEVLEEKEALDHVKAVLEEEANLEVLLQDAKAVFHQKELQDVLKAFLIEHQDVLKVHRMHQEKEDQEKAKSSRLVPIQRRGKLWN
jgi:ribosomal protein L11 methylase PrmA